MYVEAGMTRMTAWTMGTGGVLAVLGVATYLATDRSSLTALIPTGIGVLLIGCGVLARSDAMHRHAIHAALAVALLGALGSLMNVVRLPALIDGTAERPGAVIESTLMFAILAAYLVVGVRFFVAARRARRSSATV